MQISVRGYVCFPGKSQDKIIQSCDEDWRWRSMSSNNSTKLVVKVIMKCKQYSVIGKLVKPQLHCYVW